MTIVTPTGSVVMATFRGDRLRERRKKMRLSQDALGELAGVDGSYISLLERGVKTNPSLAVVARLAEALETSPSYLSGETDDPSPAVYREVALHHTDRLLDPDTKLPQRLIDHIRRLQDELGRLADALAELEEQDK